jgi:hypothetical protein
MTYMTNFYDGIISLLYPYVSSCVWVGRDLFPVCDVKGKEEKKLELYVWVSPTHNITQQGFFILWSPFGMLKAFPEWLTKDNK